jgi:S-ribosylhomocysteine lyase LuxS involved in autoinducer biosynthesis
MDSKEKKAPVLTRVKYSCGHDQEISLTGAKQVRHKKVARKGQKSLCRDCHKRAKEGVVTTA